MSIMKITILGLETALKLHDQSIFDLMQLPDGIDKDTLTDNIFMEAGDFEVLYADPYFMRQAIYTWSRKHYRTFEKWIAALNIEYSPLENYDRFEEWTDTGKETGGSNKNTTNTENSTGTNTETNVGNVNTAASDKIKEDGSTTRTEETENTVSAYDSGNYQPSDKSEHDASDKIDNVTDRTTSSNTKTDNTVNGTNTNTINGSSKDVENYNKDNEGKHIGRIHGNIGVTTSQQMLTSELEIARFNIIQQITDLFLTEFCLMIYE